MISRRVFGMGVALVAGDGLVRGIGAPAGQATPIGVQAGVSNSIDFARAVVIFGPTGSVLGVYVYAPGTTPAPGNPPIMSMGNSSVDLYGNAIHPGISSQIPGGNWVSLFQGQIEFQGGSAISGTSGGNLAFQTAADFAFIGGPVLSETASGGTLANPTIITTDPGTVASAFGTDWGASGSGANGAVFQLQPNGWVNVAIDVKTTAAAPAAEVCAIPAGYAPSASVVCGALLPTAGGGSAYPLTAFSTGTLQQAGVPGVNGVRYAGIVTYPGPGITLP
jgi:hypothetical protein